LIKNSGVHDFNDDGLIAEIVPEGAEQEVRNNMPIFTKQNYNTIKNRGMDPKLDFSVEVTWKKNEKTGKVTEIPEYSKSVTR